MALITKQLRGILAIDPAADAIEFRKCWYSWRQIAEIVDAIETIFVSLGLPREARIGVMLRNRPGHVAAALAVLASERCLVTLNPVLPDERLCGDIGKLELPVIIGETEDLARPGMGETFDAHRTAVIEIGGLLEAAALVPGRDRLNEDNPNMLAPGVAIEMLTSGTTGIPKRIPLTRNAFDASSAAHLQYEKGRAMTDAPRLRSGVQILANPLTHISGISGVLGALPPGRKICLLERFSVAAWCDAVCRHQPKVAAAVPSALKMILEARVPKADLSSLLAITTGTAPIDPAVIDTFYERYGIPVLPNYGATEFAGGVAGWSIEDFRAHWHDKRGAAGRVHSDVEARVVDPETGTPMAMGEEGILELKAPQLGVRGGWLRTTDRAVIDADHFMFIRGRADNAIVRGGFKIHPDEVVRVLEGHPAIREVSVVGIKDERLGQVPVAAIILRENAVEPSSDELTAFVKTKLLPYQAPVRYLFVEVLPRTPSMKPALPQVAALFDGP